jgi:nucleoside-diphosphate-sugar epimerase
VIRCVFQTEMGQAALAFPVTNKVFAIAPDFCDVRASLGPSAKTLCGRTMSIHPEPSGQLLVTGSRGFTGKHFVPIAAEHGFDVVCLKSDVRDLDALKAEIGPTNPAYVVHLAGISNTQCKDSKLLHETNVVGTQNLLQALLDCGKTPRRIILSSSVLVYGTSPESPVTEDQALVPFNPYAKSKIDMEAAASSFRHRLPICVVRPFNYSGVGQPTSFLIPKLVDHFVNKRDTVELGNIQVRREFNDVRYVCNAYLRLLLVDHFYPVYNICCGKAHTIKDVLHTLEDITGHKVDVKINADFVRPHDISLLYGSTARLEAAVGKKLFAEETLPSMLRWMVDNYCG